MSRLLLLLVASATTTLSLAQSVPTIPPPGQPLHSGPAGTFEIIGNSLVSAQQVGLFFSFLSLLNVKFLIISISPQLFLGTEKNVYIVDKVENNPVRIDDHPAWASGASYMPMS